MKYSNSASPTTPKNNNNNDISILNIQPRERIGILSPLSSRGEMRIRDPPSEVEGGREEGESEAGRSIIRPRDFGLQEYTSLLEI